MTSFGEQWRAAAERRFIRSLLWSAAAAGAAAGPVAKGVGAWLERGRGAPVFGETLLMRAPWWVLSGAGAVLAVVFAMCLLGGAIREGERRRARSEALVAAVTDELERRRL